MIRAIEDYSYYHSVTGRSQEEWEAWRVAAMKEWELDPDKVESEVRTMVGRERRIRAIESALQYVPMEDDNHSHSVLLDMLEELKNETPGFTSPNCTKALMRNNFLPKNVIHSVVNSNFFILTFPPILSIMEM